MSALGQGRRPARALIGHMQRHRRKYVGLSFALAAFIVLLLATDPRPSSLGGGWELGVLGRALAQSCPCEQRRSECLAAYGRRRYLSEEESRVPPILFSYPGSGNTWTRLLIDYSTGVYTGSIYDDESLMSALPGEAHCDLSVSAVKAHSFHEPEALLDIESIMVNEPSPRRRGLLGVVRELGVAAWGRSSKHSLRLDEWEKVRSLERDALKEAKLRTRCLDKGGIIGFERFIFLIRDPYDAIWSEYQRQMAGGHSSALTAQSFNRTHFDMRAHRFAMRYALMLDDIRAISESVPEEDVFILRYESLKDKSTRMETLSELVDFLGINDPDPDRLACADVLADRPDTHRTAAAQAAAGGAPKRIAKEEVYTPAVACKMWSIFGSGATGMGYGLPAWVALDMCRPLRKGKA